MIEKEPKKNQLSKDNIWSAVPFANFFLSYVDLKNVSRAAAPEEQAISLFF